MITKTDLQLKCVSCMDLSGSAIIQYRDAVNKISAETVTPRKDEFKYGKPKTKYWIDGVEKPFEDLDELIDFYNEKFKISTRESFFESVKDKQHTSVKQ